MTNVISVSTQAELVSALSTAQSGDRIELAAGNYGDLDLYAPRDTFIAYTGEVTIAAADANNPPVFTSVKVTGAQNLTFDGLSFQYQAQSGDPQFIKPFMFVDAEHVTVRNSEFIGSDPTTGQGLYVNGTSDITVEDSTFSGFHRGMVITNVQGVEVLGNDISNMGSDGVDLAGVHGATISDNSFYDFAPQSDVDTHRDFIQFWTSGGAGPSSDILISGNSMIGQDVQAIFMRSETTDENGDPERYSNVTITQNLVVTDDWHGIHTAPTDGLTVTHNTVLPYTTSSDERATEPSVFIDERAANITVTNNVLSRLDNQTSEGWSEWAAGNIISQDRTPSGENYLPDLLLNYDGEGAETYTLNSLAVDASMGASLSHIDVSVDMPRIHVSSDDSGVFFLDAGVSSFDGALVKPAQTTFTWTLPGGAEVEGQTLGIKAPEGTHQISLTMELSDGRSFAASTELVAGSPIALSVTAQSGQIDVVTPDTTQSIQVETSEYEGDPAMVLTANRSVQAAAGDSFDLRDFKISFDFALTDEAGFGHIMRIHSDWLVYIDETGVLEFRYWDSGGQTYELRAEGVNWRDGVMRQVEIAREFDTGKAGLAVDGTLYSVDAVEGFSGPSGSHGLTIGQAFSWQSAEGLLDNLEISKEVSPTLLNQIAPDTQWVALGDGSLSIIPDGEVYDGSSAINDLLNGLETEPAVSDDFSIGTDAADKMVGDQEANAIAGGDGGDSLYGKSGNDTLLGQAGTDRLDAGAGDDLVYGGDGKDKIRGNAGNDTLIGGAGVDNIRGDDGDDLISGGADRDLLSGGGGADSFVFHKGDGYDTIFDFEVGTDQVVLSGMTDEEVALRVEAYGSFLESAYGDTLYFKSLTGDLEMSDFILA